MQQSPVGGGAGTAEGKRSCCGSRGALRPGPGAAQAGRSLGTRRWVKECLKVGLTCKEMPFSPSIHLAAFLKATKKTVLQ